MSAGVTHVTQAKGPLCADSHSGRAPPCPAEGRRALHGRFGCGYGGGGDPFEGSRGAGAGRGAVQAGFVAVTAAEAIPLPPGYSLASERTLVKPAADILPV
jgi:hypothetical protein